MKTLWTRSVTFIPCDLNAMLTIISYQVDKFKAYPDLMALLFKAMAKSPPAKRRK